MDHDIEIKGLPQRCLVCGSELLVKVVRLVPMLHCNHCGAEITETAFNASDRMGARGVLVLTDGTWLEWLQPAGAGNVIGDAWAGESHPPQNQANQYYSSDQITFYRIIKPCANCEHPRKSV